MKSMLAGFAAIALVAVAADLVLDNLEYSTSEARAGSAVRLDSDPE